MLVERGVPALLIWLTVLFTYGLTLWKALRRYRIDGSTNAWPFGVMLGCVGGLIGFFISGLVHYNIGDGEVALIFYLLMAVGVRTAEFFANGPLSAEAAEEVAEYRMAA
jgi:hypothetical protein